MTTDQMILGLLLLCVVVIIVRHFYVKWFLLKLHRYTYSFFAILEELHKENLDDRFSVYAPYLEELVLSLPKPIYELNYSPYLWGYRQMVHNKVLWDEMQQTLPFNWFLNELKQINKEERRKK